MFKLLILLAASMCLAYCSQHGSLSLPITEKRKIDVPLVAIIIILSLAVGLRTQYNDTPMYVASFIEAPTPQEYFKTKPDLFDYPLFYGFQSFFRHYISDNYHLFFLVIAFFTNGSFICFFKKNSDNFAFTILLYFALGIYTFTMAAMKQCLSMAFLVIALNALIDKKYVKFYIFVFIAMLIHAYAILFAILPLFTKKPWTLLTYCAIIGVVFVVFTFESTIVAYLDFTDDVGKDLSKEYIIDTAGINLLRLAVYAVSPIISLLYLDLLNDNYTRSKNLMMNVSLLSFLIMALGLSGGSNFFGRAAVYFVPGTLCIMPWLVNEIFSDESKNIGNCIVGGAYLLFFIYAHQNFSYEYQSITLFEFLKSL